MSELRYPLAAAVLAAGALGLVPGGVALAVGTALAAAGLVGSVAALRAAEGRRAAADELLADAPPSSVPAAVAWRASELTDVRVRRRLARALRGVLKDVEAPPSLMLLPVNRAAVRESHELIADCAARLAAVDRPIDARGVARLRVLLKRSGSPLFDLDGAEELRRELALARSSLDLGR